MRIIYLTLRYFSQTTGPILNKLGTKDSWVKGILVYSNEGPLFFPVGDDFEIVKIHQQNLRIVFSRTSGPISIKLGTKHSWMKGI